MRGGHLAPSPGNFTDVKQPVQWRLLLLQLNQLSTPSASAAQTRQESGYVPIASTNPAVSASTTRPNVNGWVALHLKSKSSKSRQIETRWLWRKFVGIFWPSNWQLKVSFLQTCIWRFIELGCIHAAEIRVNFLVWLLQCGWISSCVILQGCGCSRASEKTV